MTKCQESSHVVRTGDYLRSLGMTPTIVNRQQPGPWKSVLRIPWFFVFCFLFVFSFFSHFYSPASGQAVVTGVVPSPRRFLPSVFIAHRVQQSHCSSIFHRVLLTHALAFSASQFVHKKKPPQFCTSMHSGGFVLTKLIYTGLEDSLICHRGDRVVYPPMCQVYRARQEMPALVGVI